MEGLSVSQPGTKGEHLVLARSVYSGREGAPIPWRCSFPGGIWPLVSLAFSTPSGAIWEVLVVSPWMFTSATASWERPRGHLGHPLCTVPPFLCPTLQIPAISAALLSGPAWSAWRDCVFCLALVVVPGQRAQHTPLGSSHLSGVAVLPCVLSTA